MAQIIVNKYQAVRDFVLNDDPNNEEHVGTIFFPLSVVLVYLLFVKWIGPIIMRPFKPLKMNAVLIAFNICIVLWNAYVSFNKAYKFAWLFYLSKYIDLLDTVFFVLRKKHRQISFLHVFHHSTIIFMMWGGIRYKTRGGYIGVALSVNSFVHVCTYTYYALAACGPKMQRLINPRKIYITFIQVAQFWILLGYLLWGFLSGCEDIEFWAGSVVVFLSILMLLFANFYVKNYKKKQ